MFLPLPLVLVFIIALARANSRKQREWAAVRLLSGFALICGISALLGYGS
jgi:hypothetical protein